MIDLTKIDEPFGELDDATKGAMLEWQSIETAPKDGAVFLARNADRLSFGSWPMMRHVKWTVNEMTGKYEMQDMGAWLIICDNEPDFSDTGMPFIPHSFAADKYNKSVRYEWTPLPAFQKPAPAVTGSVTMHGGLNTCFGMDVGYRSALPHRDGPITFTFPTRDGLHVPGVYTSPDGLQIVIEVAE